MAQKKKNGTAGGLAYNDEMQRQAMAAQMGRTAPKKPGAPKLTEKDQKYVDDIRKKAKAASKKK